MLLCERFRDRFANAPQGAACRIDLNECATVLGVARRRLYDITIVYEAAEVTLPSFQDWECFVHQLKQT